MPVNTVQSRMDRRHIPISGAYNVRDLGGYRTKGGVILPWRRFLRADSLHRIAAGEAERLHSEGLATVIDLRTSSEVANAANPFCNFADVGFHNLPLFDDLSPEIMGKQKNEAEDPLLGFYFTALETRQEAIREILHAMSEAPKGAVMFNCTAGKDRTGLIAALLLGIADVGREEIISDYAMTADYISDLVAEFLERSRQQGGDVVSYARMLRSPSETMSTTLDRIEADYGSIPGYLREIGLTPEQITALQTRMLPDPVDAQGR